MHKTQSRIFIAGHQGMVGSSLKRALEQKDNNIIITASKSQLDLTNQSQVQDFFNDNKFDEVYLAAARVGGIHANSNFQGEFIYENLAIQSNVIHASHTANINKLLFLGSSCIYPKESPMPISEDSLLSGKLEQTNEAYAISKIAGIKMCQSYNKQFSRDYRCIMPTNLYGPNDNFNEQNSHVIPGLIYKFHQGMINGDPSVTVWGTGEPKREFLFVDDLAEACIFIMNLDKNDLCKSLNSLSHINVGSGCDISIRELANLISEITGFNGKICFDNTKPDGVYRKLLDSSLINSLGWKQSVDMKSGLISTYEWFLKNYKSLRK